MYLTKEQFNALVSIVRYYDASKPSRVGSIPFNEQSFLLENGYCFLHDEYVFPTPTGWKKIINDKPVPPEIIELAPAKETKSDVATNSLNVTFSDSDGFQTMIDYLLADFINHRPSVITFRNWKTYMNGKKIYYVKGWTIDDFRKANRFIYDNIVEVLKESNPITLQMLLDLLYLTLVEDNFYETENECQVV